MSMTIVESIVALAKRYGAPESAQASTITEALDVLNDAMSGSDQNAEATIADAIDAIAAGPGAPAYVVSFDANTGTGTQAPIACALGSTVALPETTTLTAPSEKQFKGWGASADATTLVTKVSATEATTIYAIWEDAS